MRYESKTKTKACPPNGGAASTKSKFNGGGATQCRHDEITKSRSEWLMVHKDTADRGTRSARSPNSAPC